MRRIFLAALATLLLSVAFAESASAQWGHRGGWGYRGGWGGLRTGGFYGRPFMRSGLGWYRPGWRAAGLYGWRRPYWGNGFGRAWRPGWGWGVAGIAAGIAASSYYGYGYPAYAYTGYGYPGYGYSYGYPSCGCGYGGYGGGYGWGF